MTGSTTIVGRMITLNVCHTRLRVVPQAGSRSLFSPSPPATSFSPTSSCPVRCLTKMSAPTTAVYGSWRSPVTAQLATASAVSFQEVHVDQAPGKSDTVYWAELRFEEGGRYVVCSQSVGQKDFTAWTPADFNARTRVHEYGGGAHFVHDGVVYFSNMSDQRIYHQTAADAAPTAITPAETWWRYADGQFNDQLKKIYAIREDHGVVTRKEAKEAVNTVVCIDPETQEQSVLASGCDFYASPRVSPDGKRITWVQWNHPNMPWDDTELWVAELQAGGSAVVEGSAKKVAGGVGVSVMQPEWTADNNLLYISDQTEWWNLYLVEAPGGQHVNLLPCQEEIGRPHWVFGNAQYAVDFSGSGNVALIKGKELGVLSLKTKEYRALDTGFTGHSYLTYARDGHIYCNAGSPTRFSCVIRVHPDTGKVDVVRESKELSVDTGYISVPREISWTTDGDKTSHGFFYPPQNKDFAAPEGTLPPLLVQVHGGPTASTSSGLNLKKQYFTSRGFAILDVNYRGSTGYGRTYRNALRKNWGLCDVEDCRSGAMHLAAQKEVDGDRVCIDGGSAGGYTTLACIAFTDAFKAGASHYGVADVELLAAETHKFESRYMDLLVAPLNEENKKIYQERSPICHIDKFNCPVVFFQGDEDEIVPPNQAELMYKKLKDKGLMTALVMFEGEQHGFRKAANIHAALDGEFYFFSKVFGFEAADNQSKLDIANQV